MKYIIATLLLTACGSGYDFTIEREGLRIEAKVKNEKVDPDKAKAYLEIELDKAEK